MPAAAFGTRSGKPHFVTGSAAKGIAQRLSRHGYKLVSDPESFIVDDSPGPLHAGELERAREWGRSLAAVATGIGARNPVSASSPPGQSPATKKSQVPSARMPTRQPR